MKSDDETKMRHLSHLAGAMAIEATKVKNHLRQKIRQHKINGQGFIDECMERDCKMLENSVAEFRKIVPPAFK